MNTPILSQTLNAAPANAGAHSGAGLSGPDGGEAGPRFSDVMTSQRALQESKPAANATAADSSRQTTAQASGNATSNAGATRANTPGGTSGPDNEKGSDEAQALLAAEHGFNLSQIALSLAAQAASPTLATTGKQADTRSASRTPAQLDPTAFAGKATARAQHAGDIAGQAEALATVSGLTGGKTESDPASAGLLPGQPAGLKLETAPAHQHQTRIKTGRAVAQSLVGQPDGLAQNLSIAGTDGKTTETTQAIGSFERIFANANANPDGHGRQTDNAGTSLVGALSVGSGALHTATMPAGAPLPGLGVATPLHSPQWGQDFGRQFIALTQMGQGRGQSAELRLDPPHLGPLKISITISDNTAHAVFVSPHAGVRQAVENALPQLQQQLAQAGISLGQTSVSDQGQADQQFDESLAGKRRSGSGPLAGIGQAGADVTALAGTRRPAADALVDTFA